MTTGAIVPAAYEEPPARVGGNLTIAGHLFAAAAAFFFLAFLFAYVYLRSIDKHSLWHPAGVKAPIGYGTAIVILLVASAVAVRLARARAGGRPLWLGGGLTLGVAALGVQIAEWLTIGFGPASGGYASVFVGWTGFYSALVLLALIWIEIQLATTLRSPDAEPVGLDAASFFLSSTAAIGVVTWIVLYLA